MRFRGGLGLLERLVEDLLWGLLDRLGLAGLLVGGLAVAGWRWCNVPGRRFVTLGSFVTRGLGRLVLEPLGSLRRFLGRLFIGRLLFLVLLLLLGRRRHLLQARRVGLAGE